MGRVGGTRNRSGWLWAALTSVALLYPTVASAQAGSESPVLEGANTVDGQQVLAPLELTDGPEPQPGDYLGGFRDEETIDALVTDLSSSGVDLARETSIDILGTDTGARTIVRARVGTLRQMLAEGRIATAEPQFSLEPKATSEGVAIMDTAPWHQAGLRGDGIKVGVLDVGFTGYQSLLGTDLPPSVTTRSFHASGLETEPHGTAVAEIIHDIAPRADLVLVNFDSVYDVPQAVDYMVSQGVDVVNASIGTEIGPMDETTELSAAVRSAIDAGVTWVNSAGNEAQKHFGGAATDSNGNGFLDISGDEIAYFQVFNGGDVINRRQDVNLSWINGTTPADLWLCMYKWDGTQWNTHQINSDAQANWCSKTNTLSDRPRTRFAAVRNTSGTSEYYGYALWLNSGSPPARFDVFLPDLAASVEELEHNDPFFSLSEPGLVERAIGAGAFPSCNPGGIEPYSSRGPTVRGIIKPDVLGAAIVSTESYGDYNPSAACQNPPQDAFNGTSSASPHIAAMAALYLQASPGASPATVKTALSEMAREGDFGRNTKSNTFGWGVAQFSTTPPIDALPPRWPDPSLTATQVQERELTLHWSAARDNVGVRNYFVVQALGQPVNGVYTGEVIATLGSSARSHRVTGLVPGTEYAFWVEAADARGNVSEDGPLALIHTARDFSDANTSVFHDDIVWLSAAGITQGCNPPANDRFCPNAPVTRGQMASFITRALGLEGGEGHDYFVDDDSSVHELDIDRMAYWEITLGCNPNDVPPSTKYCPAQSVTRAQMASFLSRALLLTDGWDTDFFHDDDFSIHEFDINRLAHSAISRGCNPPTNTAYCPDQHITRGQMAAFLNRSAELINEVRELIGADLLPTRIGTLSQSEAEEIGRTVVGGLP